MTFKEKLMQEFPGSVDEGFFGGCAGCPAGYRYEEVKTEDMLCYEKKLGAEICEKCWNREIPETEEEPDVYTTKLDTPIQETPIRESILNDAIRCVCQERNNQYGEPEDCFQDIAELWSTYTGKHLSAIDVAEMMILLKVARSKSNPLHTDNYVDICGYGSIAGELAAKEDEGD